MIFAVATMIVMSLGVLAVYVEFHTYFKSRGIAAAGLFRHPPSILFLGVNAILAWVCFALIPPEWLATVAPIDGLESNAPARAVVIGLALPVILRSRFTSLGEGRDPVGPAMAYDLLFSRTAASLIQHFNRLADSRIRVALDRIAVVDPTFSSHWEERAWAIVRTNAEALGASQSDLSAMREAFETELEFFKQIDQPRRFFLADVFAWCATRAGIDAFFGRLEGVVDRGGLEVRPGEAQMPSNHLGSS